MEKLLMLLGLVVFFSCNTNKNPRVLIATNFGNIEAELYANKAPKSVAAFLNYVDNGLYKKSSFYRVLLDESLASANNNTGIIQGGIWQSDNNKAITLPSIAHEAPKQTGLSHTSGTLSFARTTLGTAKSEFFICIGNQVDYDTKPDGLGYAAFGHIIKGMKVVRDIQQQAAIEQSFIVPIEIINITRE